MLPKEQAVTDCGCRDQGPERQARLADGRPRLPSCEGCSLVIGNTLSLMHHNEQ